MKRESSLSSIDLFAGAGGLSEGLLEAGFQPLYANEIDPAFAATYARNHVGSLVDARDIRFVDPAAIRKQLKLPKGALDLIAGGPPCQGFSINAPERREDDRRNHLFRDYLRFVEEFMPRAVLIENVPGLVSFGGGTTLEAILESLEALGYTADVRILYAPHYGVPQTRFRTLVIGMRDGEDPSSAFPEPTYDAPMRVNFTSSLGSRSLVTLPKGPGLRPHTSVREALGDLPRLGNGEAGVILKPYASAPQNPYQACLREGSPGVANHEGARMSPMQLERLSYIPPGGNWTDIPHELLPKGMQRARTSDHTKRYGRADPDGLSSTILTKCDPHWGAYFHYSQDRTFSVREAARIQSFPDRYNITGTRIQQFKQIGNAVPPMLARAVGDSIRYALGISLRDRRSRASA